MNDVQPFSLYTRLQRKARSEARTCSVKRGHCMVLFCCRCTKECSIAMKFVDPERKELNMAYHFEGMDFGFLPGEIRTIDPKGYDLIQFKKIYSRWDIGFAKKGWGTIYLGNHDQPRMISRWGNDDPAYRDLSSKMLTTFILTMRATPYYYCGDELGMRNIRFDKIEDYRDIAAVNGYQHLKEKNGDLKKFMAAQKLIARDNGRTPFQWNSNENAGFSTGKPWLKVNPDYKTVNAAAQEKDPNSCLNYFRKAVKLRKDNSTLVYGKYTLLDRDNPDVYAYTRELEGRKILVLLNFKSKVSKTNTGIDVSKAKVMLGNYASPSANNTLQPYEAVEYKL